MDGNQHKPSMKKYLLLLSAGLFIQCNSPAPVESSAKAFDVNTVKDYIIAMEDTLSMAYANKDLNLFKKFYAENAVTYGEGRDQLFGKQQIINHFRNSVVEDTSRAFNFKYTTIDVFATSDEMALESGRWSEYNDAGEEIDHGFYMVLFQKVDGRLVSTRDMWNSAIKD